MKRYVALIMIMILMQSTVFSSFAVVMSERMINIRLLDSKGVGIEGAQVSYCISSWNVIGMTDSQGQVYLSVPMSAKDVTVRMNYGGARQDIRQNVQLNADYVFQTIDSVVKLTDSKGGPLEGGVVRYSWASWFDYGNTDAAGEAHKELLPGQYTVRMNYAGAWLDKKFDNRVDSTLEFKTIDSVVTVVDRSGAPIVGTSIRYCWSSWADYGISDILGEAHKELLPSSYTVRAYLPNGYKDIKQDLSTNPTISFVYTEAIKTYSLNIMNSPTTGGSVAISPTKSSYTQGEKVTLTPIPSEGYEFVSWSGVSENEMINNQLTMNANKNITANFKKIDSENPDDPKVIYVTNVQELMATETSTKAGNVTVVIADGDYVLTRGLYLTGSHITYQSESGNRDGVVLRGNFKISHIFQVTNDYVTFENLSIGEVNNHGIQIHSENDADFARISNVRFFNIKEQMIKGSGAKTEVYSNDCIVEDCLFEFTGGVAYQYYTGGIDVHKGDSWIVRNNTFKNIISPTGNLTEGAIHFWSSSKDTLVENNVIINCDRGIMFGLDNVFHYGGVIRNNTIHTVKDVGIYLANAVDAKVYNNTVFIDSTYANAIEYRFSGTQNAQIINNLTNKAITKRDNATATISNNITNASEQWFVHAHSGDLHLESTVFSVVDQALDLEEITKDIDSEDRSTGKSDIGADEYQGLVVTPPQSLVIQADKLEIIANNEDSVQFTVKGILADGSQNSVLPDAILCKDSTGKEVAISSSAWASIVPGTYLFYARLGAITSEALSVTVKKEELTNLQATNLSVFHKEGQSFITWDEINKIIPDQDSITIKEVFSVKKAYLRKITYNVYCSTSPITQVEGLKPIATVPALSGWNMDFYGSNAYNTEKPAFRYVLTDLGTPISNGKGLWVNNADFAGGAYYAVTVTVDGIENKVISSENTLTEPINEQLGQGVPVLQRIEKPISFDYAQTPTLYYYTRWEAPPNSSVEGKAFDYLVGVPKNVSQPAPVGIHMHCWGGNLEGGYGWWNDAEEGSIILASNQLPYDWWTGYHERINTTLPLKTASDWQSGVVHPYTTNRLFSFLEWMSSQSLWSIDLSRTFTAGNSMGGSGSIMAGIRFGDSIAWTRSWVGVHNPIDSPQFMSSYSNVYGKPEYNVLFEDGTPVWDYYNDIWFLKQYPKKETAFITFSNGKNDNAIGWAQAVDFYEALQETKRPHLFVWGQGGHGQRTIMPFSGSERIMPIDIRTDQSLPAFTFCSLDDMPGNGDPNDGDAIGQINAYLYWETNDIIDTAQSWEMTVGLIDKAPEASCTVDITPRRLQNLIVTPNEQYHWQNKDLITGEMISSGVVVADQNGLITLENVTVSKNKNRLVISK